MKINQARPPYRVFDHFKKVEKFLKRREGGGRYTFATGNSHLIESKKKKDTVRKPVLQNKNNKKLNPDLKYSTLEVHCKFGGKYKPRYKNEQCQRNRVSTKINCPVYFQWLPSRRGDTLELRGYNLQHICRKPTAQDLELTESEDELSDEEDTELDATTLNERDDAVSNSPSESTTDKSENVSNSPSESTTTDKSENASQIRRSTDDVSPSTSKTSAGSFEDREFNRTNNTNDLFLHSTLNPLNTAYTDLYSITDVSSIPHEHLDDLVDTNSFEMSKLLLEESPQRNIISSQGTQNIHDLSNEMAHCKIMEKQQPEEKTTKTKKKEIKLPIVANEFAMTKPLKIRDKKVEIQIPRDTNKVELLKLSKPACEEIKKSCLSDQLETRETKKKIDEEIPTGANEKRLKGIKCYNINSKDKGTPELDENCDVMTLTMPKNTKVKGRPPGSKNKKGKAETKSFKKQPEGKRREIILESIFGKVMRDRLINQTHRIALNDLPRNCSSLPDCILDNAINLNIIKAHFEEKAFTKLLKLVKEKRETGLFTCPECAGELEERAICCEGCLFWFDYGCVGIDEKQKLPEEWFCSNCSKNKI